MAEADRIVSATSVSVITRLNSGALRAGIASIAALLVYGGWAWWVNSQFSVAAGWRAAMVQGIYAFVLTLGSSLLYEFLFSRMRTWTFRKLKCVAIGVALQFVTAYGIHWQIGTPAILVTIFPGLFIGTAYAASYLVLLEKLSREKSCAN